MHTTFLTNADVFLVRFISVNSDNQELDWANLESAEMRGERTPIPALDGNPCLHIRFGNKTDFVTTLGHSELKA